MISMRMLTYGLALSVALPMSGVAAPPPAEARAQLPFTVEAKASFFSPWAMTFLPDGRLLVSEKGGKLKLYAPGSGAIHEIRGVPKVAFGEQGGLGDVVLHPDWGKGGNRTLYLSYAEAGANDTRGAAVAQATLSLHADGGGILSDLRVIWRQPKVAGSKHYSHRLAFSPGGRYLFISSGERALFDPAQNKYLNLGKIIRLYPDGRTPNDNPFHGQSPVAAQIWSLGHRNVLGMAFDHKGRLWADEMGPAGGDEFNLIVKGRNYGWPLVSEGNHYDGRPIPRHRSRPDMVAPKIAWTPDIAPAGMIFYTGSAFSGWRGDALIAGLKSKAIIRVRVGDGPDAREVARYRMQHRIREIEQGPDGALWVLEDLRGGQGGRLLKLRPRR